MQGALQLQNNDVMLFPDLPPLQAALGRIEFTEHGVNLNGVGASFLGGPLALTGGTQRDGAIVIRMAGTRHGRGPAQDLAALPALQRLGAKLSGGSRFTGAVAVKDHAVADRRSIPAWPAWASDLPAPLNKRAPPTACRCTSC